jgi:hypothetical protein
MHSCHCLNAPRIIARSKKDEGRSALRNCHIATHENGRITRTTDPHIYNLSLFRVP